MDRQLIDYLPQIMREYGEFQQLMGSEQVSVEALWRAAEELEKEGFVQTQSGAGAARWEKILGILPKDTEPVEIRNARITGRLQENLPYTYRVLDRLIQTLCGKDGYQMQLNNDAYNLTIRLSLPRKLLQYEAYNMVDRIVPANLILVVDLMYNTYGQMQERTHAEIQSHSYQQMRDEPI